MSSLRRLDKQPLIFGLCGMMFLILATLFVFTYTQENNTAVGQVGNSTSRERKAEAGGVLRRQGDIQKVRASRFDSDRRVNRENRAGEQHRSAPRQPAIASDANPTVAKLHGKIVKGGDKDFGLHAVPPLFELEAYRANKDVYLAEFAPNRIYQTAQPGPDVPALAPISSSTHPMNAGESVRLQVKTKPFFPATFVSLDLGTFQNKLNAITVEADRSGVAEVSYSATPGTVNRSHVLVGSPGASGQVSFEMQIRAPVAPGTAK